MSRSSVRIFSVLAAAIAVASCLVCAAPSLAAEGGSSDGGVSGSVVVISGIDENSTIEEIVDFYSRASAESKALGEQGASVVIDDAVDHGDGFEKDLVDLMRSMLGIEVRMLGGSGYSGAVAAGPAGGQPVPGLAAQPEIRSGAPTGPQAFGQTGPAFEAWAGPQLLGQTGFRAERALPVQPEPAAAPDFREPAEEAEAAVQTAAEEPEGSATEEPEAASAAEVEISIDECDAGYDLEVIAAAVEAAQESDSEEAAAALPGLLDLQERAAAWNASANLSCAGTRNQKRERDEEDGGDVEIVDEDAEGERDPADGRSEAPEPPGYVPGFMVEDSGETLLPASAYGAIIGADLRAEPDGTFGD